MDVQTIPSVKLGAQGPPVGVQGMGCMGMNVDMADAGSGLCGL